MVLDVTRLPGPDTGTKQQAAGTSDNRLLQMLAVAADVGWPMCWTDDLYRHDLAKLAEHPGETVLWILRDTGTHCYPVRCFNFHEADARRRTIHYWSGDHQLNWTAAELIETLSHPALRSSRMSSSVLMPPPTVSGIKITSEVRCTTSRMMSRSS